MGISFIHTADWQLGKPFGRFPAEVSARLAAARLDAIDRLAERALAEGASTVLVAGDIFDSERSDDGLLRAALARLAGYPNVSWHLLPGNHDPARAGGVWARVKRMSTPPNVALHLAPEAIELPDRAVLLPAPLAAREMRTDPTLWMNEHRSSDGFVRIGLAHGSVQGFGSLGEAAVPIDPGRRESARLDYLALGDWHGTKEIVDGVWYSGTPEPDSFADNNPGNALLVRIAGQGAPPEIEIFRTAAFDWLESRIVMRRIADLEPLERTIAGLGPARARHLLALQLTGALAASDMALLDDRLATLGGQVMHLEAERRGLRLAATKDDLETLGAAGEGIAEVARRLAARAQAAESDGSDALVAERALGLLLAMTDAQSRREGGA
jgi:DNA repair exonuclease SbcCD nuclease subunit